MAKKRTIKTSKKPIKKKKITSAKTKKNFDKSILWASVAGVILAVALICYYAFFEY